MTRLLMPALTPTLPGRGMDKDTPVAIVENGTLPNQRVFVSSLARIDSLLEEIRLTGPTGVIVGQVVRLRSRLGWEPSSQ